MLLRFFICSNARDAQQKTLFPQGLLSDKNNGEPKLSGSINVKVGFQRGTKWQ